MSEVEEILAEIDRKKPVSGVASVKLLYALGTLDDHQVQTLWKKLAGRDYYSVKGIMQTVEHQKPELHHNTLAEFGRRVPAK